MNAGIVYEYTCPETGKKGMFITEEAGEACATYPQGAVALEQAARAA